ncbi:MAG: hypothetical protein LUF30_07210 [Lachnospiraceae bacterium]|nr:hypothetical protein [Lachnospiraceae bacterium]
MDWITDEHPDKEGFYVVTLEYEKATRDDTTQEFLSDGKRYRALAIRYCARPGQFPEAAMTGEDPHAFHWIVQEDSAFHETVAAWSPDVPFNGSLKAGTSYVFEGREFEKDLAKPAPLMRYLVFAFPDVWKPVYMDDGRLVKEQGIDGLQIRGGIAFVNGRPVLTEYLGKTTGRDGLTEALPKLVSLAVNWVARRTDYTEFTYSDPGENATEYFYTYETEPFDYEFMVYADVRGSKGFTAQRYCFGIVEESDMPVHGSMERHAKELLQVHKEKADSTIEWFHKWEGTLEEESPASRFRVINGKAKGKPGK